MQEIPTKDIYLPKMVMAKLMAENPTLEPNWVAFRFVQAGNVISVYPDNFYTAALFFGVLLPHLIETEIELNLEPYGHPGHYLWFRSHLDYGHSHKQKAFLSITIDPV